MEGQSALRLPDYADEIVASGFPGIRLAPEQARGDLLDGYIESILHRELPELGLPARRSGVLRAWLTAFSAASSTTAGYEAINRAVPEDQRMTRGPLADYRDALASLWLLDPVPSFTGSRNRLHELGRAPKHQLVDPALAARLIGVDTESLLQATGESASTRALRDGPLLGALFESLVTLSVRIYAEPLRLKIAHLRTHRGDHEIDLVLHANDGRVLAIEVKLAQTADDHDVRHLNWLHERLGDDLVDRVVITTGSRAYRRPDGVAVVPLALLGP